MSEENDRHIWTIEEVADVSGPAANVRNYLEQRDVRKCLKKASELVPIKRACDIGAGYGRLSMVLAEFADEVVGFEREQTLVAETQRLLPSITFKETPKLSTLDAEDGSFDFALVFTFLQHLPDDYARDVIKEIHRVIGKGCVLLVENTKEEFTAGHPERPELGMTKGRTVDQYEEWMSPFKLIESFPRELEPGYKHPVMGSYMLFQNT